VVQDVGGELFSELFSLTWRYAAHAEALLQHERGEAEGVKDWSRAIDDRFGRAVAEAHGEEG